MNSLHTRAILLIGSFVLSLLFTFAALQRLRVDTDIVRSMPAHDQVMISALEIFERHPIHDQVAVQLSLPQPGPDILVAAAKQLEARMRQSGLFVQLGMGDMASVMPKLLAQLGASLPVLFSAAELEQQVAPRLAAQAIEARLQRRAQELASLEGIGQGAFIAQDPLGLHELLLAKLAPLAPSTQARFYKGYLLSPDGRHLLLTARPVKPGADTAFARQLALFFDEAAATLAASPAKSSQSPQLTSMGAYRAALDNEEIIRHDVQLALWISTLGIALLLIIAFPRPLLGLLSMLPSIVGASAALFVYSLLHDSISILVLGFGGALISITVDYGITYLLFLDRPTTTLGREVAQEVRAIGSRTAMLTTMGAFLILSLSGFPMFAELGQFTALGFLFTYLFTHFVFPLIFPRLSAGSNRSLPLHRLVNRLGTFGWPGFFVAVALLLILLPFSKPVFNINLSDMNSMRAETQAADAGLRQVWGDVGNRVYLMTHANSTDDLQRKNDQLLIQMESESAQGRIASIFVPSMLFPGEQRAASNLSAWRAFWTKKRRQDVEADLRAASLALGFSNQAFQPFLSLLDPQVNPPRPLLEPAYYDILAISRAAEGGLDQFIGLCPGPNYEAALFFDQYYKEHKIFDGPYFSTRLGDILFSTFMRGLGMIVLMALLLHLLSYASWRLTVLTFIPPLFAYVCTLGTLKLLGHPLDIPGLMLSIVVFGMGDDYAIYSICGYQWYRDLRHPSYSLVRATVFMAAASSLVGFGVLCFAEHSLLRSVGLTSLCGIGYSLLGAFLLLPPLLRWYFEDQGQDGQTSGSLQERILRRYRLVEAYPRMFSRFKLRSDPMFKELPAMLSSTQAIEHILDIGCGYGVPAAWMAESFPQASITAIEPNPLRVRVAARVLADRGRVMQGWAADRPELHAAPDLVLLLDMLHYVDQEALRGLLAFCAQSLRPQGRILIRYALRPPGRRSVHWHLEDWRARWSGGQTFYRSVPEMEALVSEAGFSVRLSHPTALDEELAWLLCGLAPISPKHTQEMDHALQTQ